MIYIHLYDTTQIQEPCHLNSDVDSFEICKKYVYFMMNNDHRHDTGIILVWSRWWDYRSQDTDIILLWLRWWSYRSQDIGIILVW